MVPCKVLNLLIVITHNALLVNQTSNPYNGSVIARDLFVVLNPNWEKKKTHRE